MEAVQNWLASGKSAEGVAQELGLGPARLVAWRKLLPPAAGGRAAGNRPASASDLRAQLEHAQREIRHLREQRDMLKKRWAFSPNPRRALRPG